MKIAWLGLLALGFAGVLSTSACEVTTGGAGGLDDEGGRNSGGTGGTTGGKASGGTGGTTGGSATGGSTTGGATGGSATGGTTGGSATGGTGGDDEFHPMCEDEKDPGFPATSCDVPEEGLEGANLECVQCLKKNADCCDVLKDCYATGPDSECGYGGKTLGETEYLCFQDCILDKIETNGVYTDNDQDTCSASCSPRCSGVPATATSDLVACMHDNCEDECFPQ